MRTEDGERRRRPGIWAAAAIALVAGCSSAQPSTDTQTSGPEAPVPVVKPVLVAEVPHDTSAWTQGLEFDGPTLYEGTGVAGQSQLRVLDPDTGAVLRAVASPNNYYGEGITVVGDRIWELTWQNGVAVEFDKATMTPLREVPVNGEGWGLCSEGDRLVRSDGSDRLIFHDPSTFAETGSVAVTRDGESVANLNELECVDGQVWANIWMTNEIVRIDPATGKVNTVVDATELATAAGADRQRVLNGIAHIDGDEFLITGKYWPKMYRVEIDAPSN